MSGDAGSDTGWLSGNEPKYERRLLDTAAANGDGTYLRRLEYKRSK